MTKLNNSKGDKTQKLKLWQKSKLWQTSIAQNVTKLKLLQNIKKNNCDKTFLKLRQNFNYDKS